MTNSTKQYQPLSVSFAARLSAVSWIDLHRFMLRERVEPIHRRGCWNVDCHIEASYFGEES